MKRILQIIPYSHLIPPQNGGQLRCFHLMKQLARFYYVDVLWFQKNFELDKKGYEIENVTFYNENDIRQPNDFFSLFPKRLEKAFRYRWLKKSFKGPAQQVVLSFYPIIKNLSKQFDYSVVIFEHLSAYDLADTIRKFLPNSIFILDAHNVDSLLYREESQYISGKKKQQQIIQKTKKIEQNLYKRIDTFFTCSDIDKEILRKLNNNKIEGYTIPNGVDLIRKTYKTAITQNKRLLFCGDLRTVANKSGLIWFLKNVWELLKTKIPGTELAVVGKGNDNIVFSKYKEDKQIKFVGYAESLLEYYTSCYISVVPLTIGSGTRLKIIESMAYGIPVITTSKGAEGINYPESCIQIADTSIDFLNKILLLWEDEQLHEFQRQSARKYVENYFSWQVIGSRLEKAIKSIIE